MIIEYDRKSDYVKLSECDTGDVIEVYGDVFILTEDMNKDNNSTYLVRLKDERLFCLRMIMKCMYKNLMLKLL